MCLVVLSGSDGGIAGAGPDSVRGRFAQPGLARRVRHHRFRSTTILTIKKRVDEVNVLFIATDHHGKFVRNLNQGDFTILDDHKPPHSRL